MSNEQDQETTRSEGKFGRYAYVSSLYFVSVGVLYLWGYWGTFGINILEYADFTDLIKSAAFPVASAFGAFAIGVIGGHVLASDTNKTDSHSKQGSTPQGTPKLRERLFTWLYGRRQSLVTAYLTGTALLLIFGPPVKWAFLPFLLTFAAGATVVGTDLFLDVFPNRATRTTAVFLVVGLPFFAYGRGITKAEDVRTGRSYTYVATEIEGISIPPSADAGTRLRVVGYVGPFVFFYNPNNESTVLLNVDEAKMLELKLKEPNKIPSPYTLLLRYFEDKSP
jgi:hypothetical protein